MTGFGAAQSPNKDLKITIRAVNGRYFEPRFHLGKEWMSLESDLKRRLARDVDRGTIDVYIQSKVTSSAKSALRVNTSLAKEYLRAANSLKKAVGLKDKLSLESLMKMPSILEVNENFEATPQQKQLLIHTFEKALARLKAERVREGKSIVKDISQRLGLLAKLQQKMKSFRNKANAELSKKMKTRLQQKGAATDPQRMAQELIYYLDRNDIGEELTRLQEHIREFKKLLKTPNAIGKKLDFFTQELLREVNTIGSKANLVDLTQLVVEAKSQIESIREQVQNVQ